MKTNKILLIFFMFIVLCSFTFAVKPITKAQFFIGNVGLQIQYPQVAIGKINTPFEPHFHVFNLSNGYMYREGDNINCTLHVYNPIGNHVYKNWSNVWNEEFDIQFKLSENVFNTTGTYSYIIQCENEQKEGGFGSKVIEITKNGEYNNKDIFLPLLVGIFAFCFMLLYIAFNLEKVHVFLKIIILFAVIFIQIYVGKVILNLVSNTLFETTGFIFYNAVAWFIRIFVIYIFIYLIYLIFEYFEKVPKIKGWKK